MAGAPPACREGAPPPVPKRPGGRRATGGGGYRAAAAAAPAPRHHGVYDRRSHRGHHGHPRGGRGRCRRPPPRTNARRARGCRPPTAGSAAGAAATPPAAVAAPPTRRARMCCAWHAARGCAEENKTGRWPGTRRTAGRRTDIVSCEQKSVEPALDPYRGQSSIETRFRYDQSIRVEARIEASKAPISMAWKWRRIDLLDDTGRASHERSSRA